MQFKNQIVANTVGTSWRNERQTDTTETGSSIGSPNMSIITLSTAETKILMRTAVTLFQHPDYPNPTVKTRMLFDSGSQYSYITQKLFEQLNLPVASEEQVSLYTFGVSEPRTLRVKLVKLRIFFKDTSSEQITVRVVPVLTACNSCYFHLNDELFTDLRKEELADDYFTPSSASLNCLIGLDYYDSLLFPTRREISPGVFVTSSKFGDIVSGFIPSSPLNPVVSSNATTLSFLSLEEDPVETLWSLETIGIRDNPQQNDDDLALDQFNTSITLVNGRYQVAWPWKNKHPQLPSNFDISLMRLKSLLKKLLADPKLAEKYKAVLVEQEKLQMIEKVPTDATAELIHYIPHHPVLREDRTTTKVRIVFDASARQSKQSPSLNDCLYRGPVLLNDLAGMLIRFRLNKFAAISDIEKAFLQVGLQEQARDVVRFLWLKEPNKLSLEDNLQQYRFTRVPFGIISSPFLLAATLKHHLSQHQSHLAKDLIENFYVDNLLITAPTLEQAREYVHGARTILNEMAMNLREFASNSPDALQGLTPELKQNADSVKVLGLKWQLSKDTLQIELPLSDHPQKDLTKRLVLSKVAKVFDPLGLISPVLVPLKLFVRELWRQETGWDQILAPPLQQRFSELLFEWGRIRNFEIPRWIGNRRDGDIQLHIFTDTSKDAYCAAAYLRFENSQGVQAALVFAKCRITPLKTVSIPRLELLAAVIGGRLIHYLSKEMKFHFTKRILWTDSKCVLMWLRTQRILTVFVENRLKELKATKDLEFRYVPTSDNPADIGSRGCSFQELLSGKWFKAPDWLIADESEWPTTQLTVDTNTLDNIRSELSLRRQHRWEVKQKHPFKKKHPQVGVG